jgi:hypothetical protein
VPGSSPEWCPGEWRTGHYNRAVSEVRQKDLDLPCCAEVGDFSESFARGFCNDLPIYMRWWPRGSQLVETLPMFYTPAHFFE